MKTKLLKIAYWMCAFGMLLLLTSYFFESGIKKVFLWVSLACILFYLVPFFKCKIKAQMGSKVLYMTFIFWVLSRISNVYEYATLTVIFSFLTTISALWVVISSAIYINKYCRTDVDEHLDEF